MRRLLIGPRLGAGYRLLSSAIGHKEVRPSRQYTSPTNGPFAGASFLDTKDCFDYSDFGLPVDGLPGSSLASYRLLRAKRSLTSQLITLQEESSLKEAVEVLQVEDAEYYLLDHLAQHGSLPAQALGVILQRYCEQQDLDMACYVFDYLQSHADRPVAEYYHTMIWGFCKAGRMQDARQLVDVMTEAGLPQDRDTLCSMLIGLASLKDSDSIEKTRAQLQEKGWDLDQRAAKALLTYYSERKALSQAERLRDSYLATGGQLWDIRTPLLKLYLQVNDKQRVAKLASSVYQGAAAAGPEVTDRMTFAVIALCSSGDLVAAQKLMLEALDLFTTDRRMTAAIVCLLDHLQRSERHDEVVAFASKVSAFDLEDCGGLYKALALSLLSKGNTEAAKQWIEKLKRFNDKLLPEDLYVPLIRALSAKGEIAQAASLLGDMRRRGCAREEAVAVVIQRCCVEGRTQKALQLFSTMFTAGIQPTARTLHPLILHLAETGNVPSLIALFSKLDSSSPFRPQTSDVQNITKLLLRRGLKREAYTLGSIAQQSTM